MAIVNGSDLMCFNGQNKSLVGVAKDHKLDLKATTSDISSKDHGLWKSTEVTGFEWNISTSAYYTEDYDKMVELMLKRQPIDVVFTVKKENDPTKSVYDGDYNSWTPAVGGWMGKVLITSISASATDGEVATYDLELQGVGALKKRTVAA